MAYIGVSPSNGVRQKHTYTATASQTTFSGAGAEGVSLSYRDSNYVDVYRNGVKLGDADYTATSGTSIVLGEGAAVSDIIEIIVYDVFSVADTVSKADGGVFDGNVTMAGNLSVDGNLDVTGSLDMSDANLTNVGSIQLDSISGDADTNTSITFSGSDVITVATGGSTAFTVDASQDVNLSGSLTFADNEKAIFGAGSDLQIYHDSLNSYVSDNGTGNFFITTNGSGIYLRGSSDESLANFVQNDAVSLYFNNNPKFSTTNTGINVTGTATMDGLTVDGTGNVVADFNTTNSNADITLDNTSYGVRLRTNNAGGFSVMPADTTYLNVGSNGDISFYEDTGTTPKLFWDASAERLGLGTTAVSDIFTVKGSGVNQILTSLQAGNTSSESRIELIGTNATSGASQQVHIGAYQPSGGSATDAALDFRVRKDGDSFDSPSTIMTLTGGNVGIGTSSPTAPLTVNGINEGIRFTDNNQGVSNWYGDIWKDYNGTAPFVIESISNGGAGIIALNPNGGNVGIGTSSPNFGIELSGSGTSSYLRTVRTSGKTATFGSDASSAFVEAVGSTPLILYTNAAERMRIDSSGNVLVGTTDTTPYNNSANSTADNGIALGGTGILSVAKFNDSPLIVNRTGTDGILAEFRKSGSAVGSISSNSGSRIVLSLGGNNNAGFTGASSSNAILPTLAGSTDDNTVDLGASSVRFDDIYATNGTIQTSDQQEKNTITDSDLGIDFIKRLTPKSYIFNGKTRTHYGLIAQDVETVLSDISKPTSGFAGFIKSDISEAEDGSEYRYGLRYGEFVAPLIQAVKDQQAIIEDLQARIVALENAE